MHLNARPARRAALLPGTVVRLCAVALLLGCALAPALTGQRGFRRRPPVALKVACIHPVDGPAIQNGVILLRGRSILAMGSAEELEIPEGAQVLDYPNAHAWPTMVDSLTTLGLQDAAGDSRVDGGTTIDGLVDLFDPDAARAARAGVGYAYVANRSSATWRGAGAILSLRGSSAAISESDRETSLSLRLTLGQGSRHPFDRQTLTKNAAKLFSAFDKYEESFEKYEKDLEKYEKDLEKYLEWHRKRMPKDEKKDGDKGDAEKKDGKKGDKPAGKDAKKKGEKKDGGKEPPKDKPKEEEPEEENPDKDKPKKNVPDGGDDFWGLLEMRGETQAAKNLPQEPRRRGRRSGASQEKQGTTKKGASGKDADKKDGKKEEKGPKRPKRPTEPKKNPALERLRDVLDGNLPMRVEAHRRDEVLQAMAFLMEQEVPQVILEGGTAAEELAEDLGALGTPVVVSGIGPGRLAASWSDPGQEGPNPAALAAKLHAAGVPIAIASGSGTLARHLPLFAAAAVGQGMPMDAAVRAITLTPAEILGIQDKTGSLAPGKSADIVLTDGHLLATSTRTLRVMREGRTVFRHPDFNHPDPDTGRESRGGRGNR